MFAWFQVCKQFWQALMSGEPSVPRYVPKPSCSSSSLYDAHHQISDMCHGSYSLSLFYRYPSAAFHWSRMRCSTGPQTSCFKFRRNSRTVSCPCITHCDRNDHHCPWMCNMWFRISTQVNNKHLRSHWSSLPDATSVLNRPAPSPGSCDYGHVPSTTIVRDIAWCTKHRAAYQLEAAHEKRTKTRCA